MGWRSHTPASVLAQGQILHNTHPSGLGRPHTAGGWQGTGCLLPPLPQSCKYSLVSKGQGEMLHQDSTLVSPVYFFFWVYTPFSPRKGVQSKVLQNRLATTTAPSLNMWRNMLVNGQLHPWFQLWQELESRVGDNFWREMLPYPIPSPGSCWCPCTGSLEVQHPTQPLQCKRSFPQKNWA